MPTKYLHRDGLAIHYEHTGTSSLPDTPPPLDCGRFLLFLHGVGGNGRLWSRQLQHFATAHSPLALDLPGHGRSGGLDGPASVGEAASTVAGFLDGIGAPPALVVGHGLGGQIALALALDHPSRVRSVAVVGTCAGPIGAEEERRILRDVVRGRRPQSFDAPLFSGEPDFAVVREAWGEIVKTDPRVRLQDLEAWASSDLRPHLTGLSLPVAVLHGADDRYCDPALGEALAGALPNARFESIAGAGHLAQLECPDRINAILEEICS